MLKRKLLSFAVIVAMVFATIIGTVPDVFAADITNEFTVTKVDVTHDDGTPITQANPINEGKNLSVEIEGEFNKKDVYVGDTMLIPIVANSPIQLSTAAATPWFQLSYPGEGVIGQFRLNTSAQIEVQITKDTNNVTKLTFDVGNSIRATNIPAQTGVQTGTIGALGVNQTVYFFKTNNIQPAYGTLFGKFNGNKSSDFIEWGLHVNTSALATLYKKDPIDRYQNVYVEDEFSGNSNVEILRVATMLYCPLNLTDPEPWQMGERAYAIEIPTTQYTKIDQNPGESYANLKTRLGEFEYAIYEDTVNNKKIFVMNFGKLTEESKFKLSDLDNNWANSAATAWIDKGFFQESDRTALEARLQEVFGSTNQVKGHAIGYSIRIKETFDPVLIDVTKKNTATMSGDVENQGGGTTPFVQEASHEVLIQGLFGTIEVEPDEVALVKLDMNNQPIEGVEIELQKQNGTSWDTVQTSKITDATGKVIFSGLSVNDNDHYRFVEVSAPVPYDKDSVVFKDLNNNVLAGGEFDHYNQGVVVIATNDTLKVDIDVEKKWVGTPTDEVTIKLMADGTEAGTVTLNNANSWKHTFVDLEKYDGTNEIEYSISEPEIQGYTSVVEGSVEDGFVVTNTEDGAGGQYKLGDYVWYDVNRNGIQDEGEKGVKGVKAVLMDATGKQIGETYTDKDGLYIFEDLPNGQYTVKFSDLPEGYVITKTDEGTDDAKDSDGLTPIGEIKDADNLTLDLGIYRPLYKLGDYVWYDVNRNGIQDGGESGVKGVKVVLKDSMGQKIDETYTDNNGLYIFENLPNGKYTVEFSKLPNGYVITTTNKGTDNAKDSDGLTPTGEIKDADNLTLDLGIVKDKPNAPDTSDEGIQMYVLMILYSLCAILLIQKKRISQSK